MIKRIQERRDALAAQLERAVAQYDQLEATLKERDRQILAMHGGLLELDQLLAELALLDGDTIPAETADSGQMSADDRETIILRLREERDRLMSHLGVAHETIDMAEETL